jgi:outer membrane protein assembly factor BamA
MTATKWTRSGLRVLLGLSCLLVVATARAEERDNKKTIIDDVIPSGNLRIPSQRILSMLKSKPGTEFKPEVLDEDIRTLLTNKQFLDVQVQKQEVAVNKVCLYFVIKEYPPIIQDVIYKGNKNLKPEELETIAGLRKGAPLSAMAVQMGRNAILRRYQDMGRTRTVVEVLEGNRPDDQRVVYTITESDPADPKVQLAFEAIRQDVSLVRMNRFVADPHAHESCDLVGQTVDSGNPATRDRVILRQILPSVPVPFPIF